jgi:hypothetical protein
MRLEEMQMHDVGRLFKPAVIGLAAACRTIQLVDARDRSPRPAADVIDPALLPAAEAIGATLEGKTERQKNYHPPHSLAWMIWMVARLGGWNCYYKPHPSPHFVPDIDPPNSPLLTSISANRCISGNSRCCGMFGINS